MYQYLHPKSENMPLAIAILSSGQAGAGLSHHKK